MIPEGIKRSIRLGVRSLLVHKLRSALTTLGVLFGVSSVIAMLAIGEGASEEAQEQIRRLGSQNVILRSIKPQDLALVTDVDRSIMNTKITVRTRDTHQFITVVSFQQSRDTLAP